MTSTRGRSASAWLACPSTLGIMNTSQGRLASQTPPPMIDYTRQVHPILAERCLVCHSQDKRSGGLSLATYADVLNGGRSGAAVKPGRSADSLIVQRITGPAGVRMPVGGRALSTAEVGLLQTWSDPGARAPQAS